MEGENVSTGTILQSKKQKVTGIFWWVRCGQVAPMSWNKFLSKTVRGNASRGSKALSPPFHSQNRSLFVQKNRGFFAPLPARPPPETPLFL